MIHTTQFYYATEQLVVQNWDNLKRPLMIAMQHLMCCLLTARLGCAVLIATPRWIFLTWKPNILSAQNLMSNKFKTHHWLVHFLFVLWQQLERWGASIQDYEVLIRETPGDEEVGKALFEAKIQLKTQRGEDIKDMKFGSNLVLISSNERFRHFVTSPGSSFFLVHLPQSIKLGFGSLG